MKPIVVVLLLLLLSCCVPDALAQGGWTTPVRINPTTLAEQDLQQIAIGPQRLIAIACREGNVTGRMAVYRSTDHGSTFLRTEITAPPVLEFEMNRIEALSFDGDGNLYLLWSWKELFVGTIRRMWLVLSKSTDGGQSFANIWSNGQRTFGLQRRNMLITRDQTIHIVRDSALTPPRPGRQIYTKFVDGNPANKVEVVLPQPGDTVYVPFETDILLSQSILHYSCYCYASSLFQVKLYYTRSTDGGATFPPMVVADSALPQFGVSADRRVVLFGRALENSPYPYLRLTATYVNDSTIGFSPRFMLGTKWLASDGSIRLLTSASQNYLVYGGIETAVGAVTSYYKYNTLDGPPTDSTFFSTLEHPDFALDSLGGKYLVARRQTEFRVYFSKRDVIASIEGESQLPSATTLYQNFPNPFNPVTTIEYAVAPLRKSTDELQRVRLSVYDILGRHIASLVDEPKQPGRYRTTWGAVGVSSGVYFTRLELDEALIAVRKLLLIR